MDIRFYDNERNNWDNDMKIHTEIAYMEVDEETPNNAIQSSMDKSLKKSALNHTLNKKYIAQFKANNTYAVFLDESQTNADKKELDKIIGKAYPTNGMDDHVDNLLEWSSSSPSTKVALFDWDRTITAVEGLYSKNLMEKIDSGDVKLDDLVLFVMGGEERLQKYKDMFAQLIENKLPFFILTHNPNASSRSPLRKLYLDMIHEVTQTKAEKHIIDTEILLCSSDHCYKKHVSACATVLKKYLENCNKREEKAEDKEAEDKEVDEKTEMVEEPPKKASTKTTIKESRTTKKRKMGESMIDSSEIVEIPEPTKTTTKRKRTIKGGKNRRRNQYKTRKNKTRK